MKYWIKPDIENRIKAGQVDAYFNSRVREITLEHVCSKRPRRGYAGQRLCLRADRIPSRLRVFMLARHQARRRGRQAARGRSPDAGEQCPWNLSCGRHHRGYAHQRGVHRERPFPRPADRRRFEAQAKGRGSTGVEAPVLRPAHSSNGVILSAASADLADAEPKNRYGYSTVAVPRLQRPRVASLGMTPLSRGTKLRTMVRTLQVVARRNAPASTTTTS